MTSRLLQQLLLTLTLLSCAFCTQAALPLWVLETDQGRVYLLGSIHALTSSSYPLPAAIDQAYQRAGVVVVEVDLMQTGTAEMSRVMQDQGMFAGNEGLETAVSGKMRAQIEAYLAANDLSWNQVYRMRPWLLNLTISQQELNRLGYDPALGIDQHFLDRAYRDGKKVASLETFHEQIDVLANDPMDVQVAALQTTLDSVGDFENQIKQFLAAWRQGDADKMLALTMAPAADNPLLAEQAERLIFARNERMAKRIIRHIGTGQDTLVIIGALHMAGDRGVIKLLQADYPIRQISQ